MNELLEDVSTKLAKEHGLKFNGIWPRVGNVESISVFTNMVSGNTFAARNREEFLTKMARAS